MYAWPEYHHGAAPYMLNPQYPELLTNQVWPKSRMLFAIVSKMSKEGIVNRTQRGKLKDLILDYDSRMLAFLHQCEIDGDRQKLYSNFVQLSLCP